MRYFRKEIYWEPIVNKNFAIFREDGLFFMNTSHVKNDDVVYNYCRKYGHMKDDCYVKRNANLRMNVNWILRDTTNSSRTQKQMNTKIISLV